MPSPYYVDLPVWFPDELRQSEDRLNRRYMEMMNATSAMNVTHTGVAASTATATAQLERFRAQSEILRQMQQRAFEMPRLDTVIHDEWRYMPSAQVSRTLQHIKDTYARARAYRQSNFSKLEERVRELQSNIARRAKLRTHTTKTTRSFSSW